MSDLKAQFEEAVELVRTAEGDFKPSDELKLKMYGLFKQASEGDAHGPKPGRLKLIARMKFEAWESRAGMSKEDAMQSYVDEVSALKAKLGG